MSLVLRHRPDKLGLEMDENGWVEIDQLVAQSKKGAVRLSDDLIRTVVAENDKKRFVVSEDGKRIRAAQGHSISIDLGLEHVQPPDLLFHGTADRNLDSIREHGLIKGRRQHVHLSIDHQTAVKVGQRHGRPVVLTVRSGDMCRDGLSFYISDNGVWLTDHVPPRFLEFPA
jgi:putative RNA 2'-phosphotransferase